MIKGRKHYYSKELNQDYQSKRLVVYALTLGWASLQSPKLLANKQEELNQPHVQMLLDSITNTLNNETKAIISESTIKRGTNNKGGNCKFNQSLITK